VWICCMVDLYLACWRSVAHMQLAYKMRDSAVQVHCSSDFVECTQKNRHAPYAHAPQREVTVRGFERANNKPLENNAKQRCTTNAAS
jgi:hypothetical protein